MWHITDSIRATDFHTAGEPFRIVTDGLPPLRGTTVAERRIHAAASSEFDAVRQLLCQEPRGHADMYGGFIVPPDDDGAAFGVLFWHKDGYSTACGHGTIALGVWAVQTGRVAANPNGVTPVTIDVPSGRVTAYVHSTGGTITNVVFENVESYAIARDIDVPTSRGIVQADLGYSGAIYASISAASVDLGDTPECPHQRNVTVFADGEVDRSPCGSGTGTRLALLTASGRMREGLTLTHDSIVGTRFLGRVRDAGNGAIIPEVEGMAYATGEHSFTLDQADPVGTGFVLR
jgi:proline racemase